MFYHKYIYFIWTEWMKLIQEIISESKQESKYSLKLWVTFSAQLSSHRLEMLPSLTTNNYHLNLLFQPIGHLTDVSLVCGFHQNLSRMTISVVLRQSI